MRYTNFLFLLKCDTVHSLISCYRKPFYYDIAIL